LSEISNTDFVIEHGELKEEIAMIEDLDRERQRNNNSNASEVVSSCESKALTNNPLKYMMTYQDSINALPDLSTSEL